MGSRASKTAYWCLFLAGLTVSVFGIMQLHVGLTVAALIVASTAGMLLLNMRAAAHVERRGCAARERFVSPGQPETLPSRVAA